MPSMPLFFWGDDDGARYRASYFETFPGVWRHGDFFEVNERGGCFVRGRSDAVLNRQGVRIGTAEIYRVVEDDPAVLGALIVNLDLPDGGVLHAAVRVPRARRGAGRRAGGATAPEAARGVHAAARARPRSSPSAPSR